MALIINLAKKTRAKNVYEIILNSGEVFEIYDELIILNNLCVGKEIDLEEINQIKNQSEEKIGLSYAMQILARGMKTKRELELKLKQKRISECNIEKVLRKIEDYGYLNDEAYCEMYFNCNKNQKGKRRIVAELLRKGVDEKVVNNFSADLESDEETARILTQKYLRNKELTFKTKTKLYSHLLSKGFDYDVINSILGEYEWFREENF